MNWRGLLWLGLLLAALAGSWLLTRVAERTPGESGPRESADTGYFLSGAKITQLDENGEPLYELYAERILEDRAARDVQLRGVHIDYRFSDARWSVEAERGQISGEGTLIMLSGQVRAVGTPIGDSETAIINTDSVQLDTRSHLVTTDAPVRLQLGRHEVRSVGMHAYLKDNRLELQSQVNGRFTP